MNDKLDSIIDSLAKRKGEILTAWTSQAPTEAGYYWLGVLNHADLTLVEISFDESKRGGPFNASGFTVKKFDTICAFTLESYDAPSYIWWGPISPPRRGTSL